MLLEVGRRGFLTNSQISDLYFAGYPNRRGEARSELAARAAADRALKRLWENRYLDRRRVVLSSRHTDGPYIAFVNVLTGEGVRVVRAAQEELGASQELRSGPDAADVSHQQLEHTVALYDLFALLSRACRERGTRLSGWHDDRQLAALRAKGAVGFFNVPDAVFVVGRARAEAKAFLLELDLGTESVLGTSTRRRDWRGKIEAYEQYFRGRYAAEELFAGLPQPVVLTVTTGPERLTNLLEAIHQAGGDGTYWYTTRGQLDPPVPQRRFLDGLDPATRQRHLDEYHARRLAGVWAPCWRACVDDQPRSLGRWALS